LQPAELTRNDKIQLHLDLKKNIPYVTKEGKTQLNGKHNFPQQKKFENIIITVYG
jgi:hypothetical protein